MALPSAWRHDEAARCSWKFCEGQNSRAKEKKMDRGLTDTLTVAAAAWLNMALEQLDPEQRGELVSCLDSDLGDLQVVIRLRRGAVELEGTDDAAGKCITLYREVIEPLRLSPGFAEPEGGKKH
jgi:hypothetical protein